MFVNEESFNYLKLPHFIIDQFYYVKSFVDRMVKFHLGKCWKASEIKCGLFIEDLSFKIIYIMICAVKNNSYESFFIVDSDAINYINKDSNVERYEFVEREVERGTETFIEYKHIGDFILNTL